MLNIGVVGAGAIGRTHIAAIAAAPGFALAGIVDPSDTAADLAAAHGVAHHRDLAALLDRGRVDGVIIATPNDSHVALTCAALRAGVPVLLEKPIANGVAEAAVILDAEAASPARVLVGHHRRHNPMVAAVKEAVAAGRIGRPTLASVACTLWKPDDYFDVPWRRTPGVGGPVLINMIHEIDLLRHLLGDVVAVSGMTADGTRHLPVEDTGAAVLRFAGGALATIALSDAAVGPWAWDLASGENPRFARSKGISHTIAGTAGGIAFPEPVLWRHDGVRSWATPQRAEPLPYQPGDAFAAQLRNFAAVIAGDAEPLVTALEAAKTIATIAAVATAASTGRETVVESVQDPRSPDPVERDVP